MRILYKLATVLVAAGLVTAAFAQDDRLDVAFEGGAVTLDPHARSETTTFAWQHHIFDTLTRRAPDGAILPWVLTDWENVEPTVWRMSVREGMTFHDGTPVTAEDVAYSLTRAATAPESEMKTYVGGVTTATAIDDGTVEVETAQADPALPINLSNIALLPKDAVEANGMQAFLENPIGSGPYTFVDWQQDERLELVAYDDYWGDVPEYREVLLRNIPSGSARVAALLSGEVDIAQKILPQDFARVERDPNAYVTQAASIRTIYLTMDYWRTESPGLPDGIENPFLDPRVRLAVWHAIDNEGIVEAVMGGAATVAEQFPPPAIEFHDPDAERPAYDPERARELLAEAGYEDGFRLILDSPNDRYLNDEFVAEAIAGMLSEVGIDTDVRAQTRTVFFPSLNEGAFTMYMAGWGWTAPYPTLPGFMRTRDMEAGHGTFNRPRYSSDSIDEAFIRGDLAVFDDDERIANARAILDEAIYEDVAYIPLYYENTIAGVRSGIEFESRPDEVMYAFEAKRDD
ncbi:MAG: ABC transporter substrate-binding protein [Trueperaceae bacterium]|nr:ABC transporter substrate-binding protein [Trueperaceae bacterium]